MIALIVQFFERAGFFFVPILAILGYFQLRSLKSGRGKIVFLIVTALFLAAYLICGGGSSRYLLIPLIPWGILAGAGVEFVCNWLHRIPFMRRFSLNQLIMVAAVSISVVCIARLASRNVNHVVPLFSKMVLERKEKNIFTYCVGFKDFSKINDFLHGIPGAEAITFELWDDAISHFISRQYEDRTFYFCVEIPRKFTAADFKSWFRSCYYVYPFDVLQDYCYRKKRYLFLKFNRKTGEKGWSVKENFLSDSSQKKIPLSKWKYNWYRFPIAAFYPEELLSGDGFFAADNMRQINGNFYMTDAEIKSFPSDAKITYCNALFWQEAHRKFQLTSSAGKDVCAVLKQTQPVMKHQPSPSEEKPLVLIPPYVPVPETFPDLFLSNAVPAYRKQKHNIVFAKGKEVVSVTGNDKTVSIQITEKGSGQTFIGDIPVRWMKNTVPSNPPPSLLLVHDSYCNSLLSLKQPLAEFFGPQCRIDCLEKNKNAKTSLDFSTYSNWQQKKYHAIVLNILLDPIARPWSFPFQTGPATDDLLTRFIKELHEKYPGTPCFMILPPPATDMPSFYSICKRSPQLSRLSHYRVCDAVQRWFIRTKPAGVYLVPLYFCVNPETDYYIHLLVDSEKVYSGNYFRPEAMKKFAEILGLSILHFTKQTNF